MAEVHQMERSPQTPSLIPVISPRPSRSALPSSLSLPQLSLVHPSRRSSGNTPPIFPSPSSNSSGSASGLQTPSSSIPSFRSLRSFLPFGQGKSQATAQTPNNKVHTGGNGSKSPFATLSSVRRSIASDRKGSSNYLRVEEPDNTPVISIEASPYLSLDFHDEDKQAGGSLNFPISFDRPQISTPSPGDPRPPRSSSPAPPLSTDLSTIMESETSGISKHIPFLDESREASSANRAQDVSSNLKHPTFTNLADTIDISLLHASSSKVNGSRGEHTPESDTSALDLSTSKVEAEVLDAMMVKDFSTAHEWLKGVVVDDTADAPPPASHTPVERQPSGSFNMTAVDPGLAALLSPNRISEKKLAAMADHPSTITFARPSPPSRPNLSPAPQTIGPQSSPVRRTFSLSKSSGQNRPASSLPRLARAVTGHVNSARYDEELDGSVSAQNSPERTSFEADTRRVSSDTVPRRRQPLPSPLSTSSLGKGRPRVDSSTRRSSQARVFVPSRHVSTYAPISTSRLPPRPSASAVDWDSESVIPLSRTSSSLGRRAQPPMSTTDTGSQFGASDRERFTISRHRKRSMSVEETSPTLGFPRRGPSPMVRSTTTAPGVRPSAEWLGPRTAKAFAAAGLLDFDKEDRTNEFRSASRFSTSRTSERDYRSQYAPSRTGFSETSGSGTPWGRSRSGSRAMTTSDTGGALTESPTFSTPRTTFSGSTAPTSVSASSSHLVGSQLTLQSMKDKHDQETEALLSALSDSQRLTKVLRDENNELRDRIQSLEHQLEGALNHIRHLQSAPSPLPSSSRKSHDRVARNGSFDGSHKASRLRKELFVSPETRPSPLYPEPPISPPAPDVDLYTNPSRKRFSATSSNFPLLPSNMSLLMHEDEDLPDGSGALSVGSISPPSPSRTLSNRSDTVRHRQSRSMSSVNISPTTTTFSMTEMNSSPRSLLLRPEHELHLGDMASLDLHADEDDDIEDNGG